MLHNYNALFCQCYNNIFATDSMWVSIVMVVYLNIVIACDARRRVNVQTCG